MSTSACKRRRIIFCHKFHVRLAWVTTNRAHWIKTLSWVPLVPQQTFLLFGWGCTSLLHYVVAMTSSWFVALHAHTSPLKIVIDNVKIGRSYEFTSIRAYASWRRLRTIPIVTIDCEALDLLIFVANELLELSMLIHGHIAFMQEWTHSYVHIILFDQLAGDWAFDLWVQSDQLVGSFRIETIPLVVILRAFQRGGKVDPGGWVRVKIGGEVHSLIQVAIA